MEYYYLAKNNQIKGPFSATGMRCLAAQGIIDENTKIIPGESICWQRQVFIKQPDDLGPCPHCGELLQGTEVPVVCPHCCGPLHPGTESPWGNVRYSMKRFFSGKGRATRREFWCYLVFSLLVVVGIVSLGLSLGELHHDIVDEVSPVLLLPLVLLPLIGIAVMVRRMHDCGKSGWFILRGGLFLLFFKRSQPGPNEYGPSVPYPHG